MTGFLLHVGMTAICTHSGQIIPMSTNTRVLVSGQPVVLQSDTYNIVGCPFVVSAVYHPCIIVKWLVPSIRVKVNGQPVILQESSGICQSADQSPQGIPTVIQVQVRVKGI